MAEQKYPGYPQGRTYAQQPKVSSMRPSKARRMPLERLLTGWNDPGVRNLLRDTLATRDQVTADLAKGDATALSEIQPLLSKLEQTAKH